MLWRKSASTPIIFPPLPKAELSNGAQAVDILNRIDALYDLHSWDFWMPRSGAYRCPSTIFWRPVMARPEGSRGFYREVRLYQEHHGTGSFTQRTFVPAGGLCELNVNHSADSFRVDLEFCRREIESDMEITWWVETGARGDSPRPGFRHMPKMGAPGTVSTAANHTGAADKDAALTHHGHGGAATLAASPCRARGCPVGRDLGPGSHSPWQSTELSSRGR